MSEDCIFCKIAAHEAEAEIHYEDDEIVAFTDIHPQAPLHLLVVPKKHIESLAKAEEADAALLGKLLLTAKHLAYELGLSAGYRVQINVGRSGGQIIDHIHIHLLGTQSLNSRRV